MVERETFGDKECPKIVKTLAVQVRCENKEGKEDETKKKNEEEADKDEDEEDKESNDGEDKEKQKQDM